LTNNRKIFGNDNEVASWQGGTVSPDIAGWLAGAISANCLIAINFLIEKFPPGRRIELMWLK